MRLFALLLVLSAGCAHQTIGAWNSGTRSLCSGQDCYEVGPLGPGWQVVTQKGGMSGFFHAASGGIIMSNSNCRDDAEAAPLSSLTAHMLVGYTERHERSTELLGIVPVVSAVMGTTAGGPSMRAILSHWSIMVKGSGQIFAAASLNPARGK